MDLIDPIKFGAKPCKRCNSTHLELSIKTLDRFCNFVEITCKDCSREATSDIHRYTNKGVAEVVFRWNSSWPEISHYHDGETEGVRYGTDISKCGN